ncbi:MAG: hypothetical protein GW903_01100 [Alphaproteobacteria bacterium]|nr:hypothetical protein [Alphaproteobacteria bacterium]NCQ87567.1 hypothetical protein [Alphaproteobacteria bacterium]NCT06436.1 hypothetical protein [Alphaproteobacteria bacterium]
MVFKTAFSDKFYTKMTAIVLMSVSGVCLNACDHYSDKYAQMKNTPALTDQAQMVSASSAYVPQSDITQIEPAAGTEFGMQAAPYQSSQKTFSQYLKEGYMEQARYEQDVAYDYKAAKFFTDRAYPLSNGQMVAPASLQRLPLDPDAKEQLTSARAALVDAIKNKDIPQNRYTLAKAQVNFDCWVDHKTENKKKSACKAAYLEAMDAVQDPELTEMRFPIAFNGMGTTMSEDDRASLQSFFEYYQLNENDVYKVQIIGNNTADAAQQLKALQSILEYNGVAPHKISKESFAPASYNPNQLTEIVVQKRLPVMNAPIEARVYTNEESMTIFKEQGVFN